MTLETSELSISIAAFLIPGISLLFLSYSNKFLTIGQLIRDLEKNKNKGYSYKSDKQVENMEKRIELIRKMQLFAASSFILSLVSVLLIFFSLVFIGKILFVSAVVLMIFSLGFCFWEIRISTVALGIVLKGLKKEDKND